MHDLKMAVIYCRVSSVKQVTEGNGLASQETRCREYAKHRGYEVIEIFHDEGLSGKLMDRPNMKAMLDFLRRHRNDRLIVIIDDISRLARDIETHIQLRTAITDTGSRLESPSIEFGEDSDSRLVEHLLASVAAHQREKNAEQVKNRMLARVRSGYWCFFPPPGYIYEKVSGCGKMLVRDEPVASVIAEALEAFASGLLETQTEVKRFLEASPRFDSKVVYQSRVKVMLTNPLYAGYLDKPEWNIDFVKGKHEPLISYGTYRKIQDRLQTKATAPARKDISDDFPLRGFVTCGCCGTPLTACWSKGRNGKYPYYLCPKKGCEQKGKSVRKEKIEGEFEELLREMKPSRPLLIAAACMFTELWDRKREDAKTDTEAIHRKAMQVERKTELFLDRIAEADSPTLITAYEDRIRKLKAERIRLDERMAENAKPLKSFEETFRTAFEFLGNPLKLWQSGILEHQRAVLKLAFEEKLPYDRNEGFRTARMSLPHRLLQQISTPKSGMVHLSVETSNQLFNTLEEWEVILRSYSTKLPIEYGIDPDLLERNAA